MFNEEKVKKDLKKMAEVYAEAIKEMDAVLARQKEIAEKIYKIKQEKSNT
ncbi:MAG: hypothetical protein PHP25_01670 [Candidatus Moranbacteria bacterium]|nr:hypothetical protein [Candidatus Moranbacteria bacterium]